jgi:transcription initiation factor TFIIIB Brf1 subunit/transcription initiation factor TFIIB
VTYQDYDNLDKLSEKELLQIARERLQEALKDTKVSRESLEKTLQELSRKKGLQAVLENPERFADLVEDLELAELVRERAAEVTIKVDLKEL